MQSGVVADNRKLSGQTHNPEQQSPPVHRRGRPMCRPAWQVSTRNHAQWQQNETPHPELFTTKNTKPHERKKRVSPDAYPGRAQRARGRSCHVQSGTGFPTPIQHGRTSQPWHTHVVFCWAYSNDLRGFRVPRTGPTVQVQTRRTLPKRVAPDSSNGSWNL